MYCFLITFWALSACNRVNAQEDAHDPMADFARLEGRWEGKATLVLEGNTFTFTYYAEFKKTSDGKGMLMEESFNSPELGALHGTNLIGYNANDGKIHWFSVDNFGTTHDHSGTWKNRDHFSMSTRETVNNMAYVEEIDLKFTGEDSMELSLLATMDGKEYETIAASFKRVAK